MEKVVIAGGTGFIGQKLTAKLKDKYKVIILSRSAKSTIIDYSNNSPQVLSFDFNESYLSSVLDGAKAVINLSGAPIVGKRWTESYKKELIESRTTTSQALCIASNKCNTKPELYIGTSGIGYYGDRDDEVLTENSKSGNDFVAEICRKWEQATDSLNSNIRKVIVRIGVVLDKEQGALPKLALPFKLFAGGWVGSGKQWVSWIHIDDLSDFFVKSISKSNYSGVFNLAAPNPVRMKEMAQAIGKAMGRPSFLPAPSFAIKLALGESASVVLGGQHVVSERLSAVGFQFQYKFIGSALEDIYNS